MVVLLPDWSVLQVTGITGSESVVPDTASSSEQSPSRWPLEPAMQPELSSPCWPYFQYRSVLRKSVPQALVILPPHQCRMQHIC